MRIGIDFGTCFSSAAWVTNGVLRYVTADYDVTAIPSSGWMSRDGALFVGQEAEDRALDDPSRLRREVKRDLGIKKPYMIEGRELHPHALVSAILGKLRELAARQAAPRDPLVSAVVGVPATYGTETRKRQLLRKATEEAGFTSVELLPEPVAAAIDYDAANSTALHDGDVLLVYDLGGAGFTASLVRKRVDTFEVIAVPVTSQKLSGSHFDYLILEDLRQRVADADVLLGLGDGRSPASMRARLKIGSECHVLKHKLSSAESAHIHLPQTPLTPYVLTRAELDRLITPTLEETAELCRKLIEGEGLKTGSLTGILLSGGCARMPYIARYAEKQIGRPVLLAADPALAVCGGAAWRAAAIERAAIEPQPPPARETRYRVADDAFAAFQNEEGEPMR